MRNPLSSDEETKCIYSTECSRRCHQKTADEMLRQTILVMVMSLEILLWFVSFLPR